MTARVPVKSVPPRSEVCAGGFRFQVVRHARRTTFLRVVSGPDIVGDGEAIVVQAPHRTLVRRVEA